MQKNEIGSQVWTPLRGRTTRWQPLRGSIDTVHTARNVFLRRDQASPVSRVPSMHLTVETPMSHLPCFFFSSSAALKQTPAPLPVLFVTVATGINAASGAAAEDRYT